MTTQDHSAPTWPNQLWHARQLLISKGFEALDNPHGMIGRKCGACFCCAAAYVLKQDERSRVAVLRRIRG
jgi:hypothetical protein